MEISHLVNMVAQAHNGSQVHFIAVKSSCVQEAGQQGFSSRPTKGTSSFQAETLLGPHLMDINSEQRQLVPSASKMATML